jgi:hypothetical protein
MTFPTKGAKGLIFQLLKNRKDRENISMNILKTLLTVCKKCPSFFDFFIRTPNFCYLYANFLDFVPKFVEYYRKEMSKYAFNKEDHARILQAVLEIYPWYVNEL